MTDDISEVGRILSNFFLHLLQEKEYVGIDRTSSINYACKFAFKLKNINKENLLQVTQRANITPDAFLSLPLSRRD